MAVKLIVKVVGIPGHPEIRDELVRKICRDLGIDPPEHT